MLKWGVMLPENLCYPTLSVPQEEQAVRHPGNVREWLGHM